MPAGSYRFLNAAVSEQSIQEVDFYLDGVQFGAVTSAPYNLLFAAPTVLGAHTLTAKAIDNNGFVGMSNNVSISVGSVIGTPPTIGISTPATGSFLPQSTSSTAVTIPITGTAADSDGTITRVELFINGSNATTSGLANVGVAAVTGGNWTINWSPATIGTTSIVAIATDDKGNAIASPALVVTVTDNSSPAISLTLSPNTASTAASTALPAGATRNIVAAVTPTAGRAVVRVEFFINGTKVGEDDVAPYSYRFTAPAATGTYVFSARATDSTGLARDAQVPLTVTSAVGQPPTVNLITPINNSIVVPGTAVNLAASALATGGTIASVQFYANGSPTAINSSNAVTTAPYVSLFTPTAPGTYVFDAIATDDRGNTTVSNAVTITAAFGMPTITITSPNANSTARAAPNIPLVITASAQGGSGAAVLLVEFLLDGVQIGTKTTPTTTGGSIYSFAWTPTILQLGAHQLTARVTDINSLTVTSSPPVNVNVATVVGTPPIVTISTQPAQSATSIIQTLSTVNFIANAFASGSSSLSSVEFFLNDTSVGLAAREQTSNVYRLAYNFGIYDFSQIIPDNNGRFPLTLYAIARDSNGNQTISSSITLSIAASISAPPTVGLAALGPASVAQGTAFLMVATPADSDGTVTSLQLYVNGVANLAITPAAQAPVTYSPPTAGNFNLYVVATDETGNTAVSSPSIVLNVTAINPPNTALVSPADDSTVTTVGAPVFLVATASGSNITQIPTVSFVVTGSTGGRTTIAATRVGTTTTYRAVWTPAAADSYTVVSSAALGTVSANSAVSHRVLVNNVVGIAPVVSSLVFPASASSASTATLTAIATSASSAITGVEFFINLNSVGQGTRAQQTNLWSITTSLGSLTAGANQVVAIAHDASGNAAASTTGTITITAATSGAPAVTISASPTTVAFTQPAQLTANAIDADGTVSSVQYFVNGTNVGTSTTAPLYTFNWTSTQSGTFNVYGVATDNTGNTAVSPTIQVTVLANNPILVNDAFILQTYTDITNASPNSVQLANYDAQLAGTLTRAQLVSALTVNNTNFTNIANALAAYYVLMGQWPTTANYTTIFNARGNLATVCGLIIAEPEYVVKYGITPTAALLDTPSSQIPEATFLTQLYQNAGLGVPLPLQLVQFRSNPTSSLPLALGRGYDATDVNSTAVPPALVGLNTALAEFITFTNVNNTALLKLATAAALYYQLDKPQIVTAQAAQTATTPVVTQAAATTRIAALAAMPDTTTIADAVLKDVFYSYRFVTITGQPQSLTVAAQSGALFSVTASGQPPLSYQWLFNGSPIAGATNPLLSVTNVSSANAGTYTVNITSAVASATSDPTTLTLSTALTKLGNISTRGVTGAGAQTLIAGFVVRTPAGAPATQIRQMLIRVIGPGLAAAPFNISGFLADPRFEVYGPASATTPIITNDNWGTQTANPATNATAVSAIQQAATRAGAFPLPNTNSADAVFLATLAPGNYTVMAKGPDATATGVVLIEVYDATPNSTATTPKSINVSTRGSVGTGANSLIAGFVINGTVSRRMLIRGVGPTLASFGLSATSLLADPQIALYDSTSTILSTNDNWASGADAAIIAAASVSGGAFPLANGSKDAAMLLMLAPGLYTVQLTGVGNTTGIGLVEVYDVDP